MKKTPDILIALDSFKGSLSSLAGGNAVKTGILHRIPDANITVYSVGDGGEGTADALCQSLGAQRVPVNVHDPYLFPVTAEMGLVSLSGRKTAIFDMASPCGIELARLHGLEIDRSTTYGVGEMIREALLMECEEIIVGLGGSGTSDGGMGALCALGAVFTDADGTTLPGCTASLGLVHSCDLSHAVRLLEHTKLTLLYDVGVALTGDKGAVQMFSRQKGASEDELPRLEEGMKSYAAVCDKVIGSPLSVKHGAGAAGGLGYGLSLIGGQLNPGADVVLKMIGFDTAVKDADLIITGEGKTDKQTETGKLPCTVARHSHGKPVVCLCGKNEAGKALYEAGMDAVFAICDGPISLEESMARTGELLEKTGYNLAGILRKLF